MKRFHVRVYRTGVCNRSRCVMDWWCNSLRVELENTHIFLQEKLNACGSPCSG